MVDEAAILRGQISALEGDRDPLARATLALKRRQLAGLQAAPARRNPRPETGGSTPQEERPATTRQLALLRWIAAHPRCSIAEIVAGMGVASTNGVHVACASLRAKGLLAWEPRTWRSIQLTDAGRAAAGVGDV